MKTIELTRIVKPSKYVYDDGGIMEISPYDPIPKVQRKEIFNEDGNGNITVDYSLPHQFVQTILPAGKNNLLGKSVTYVKGLLAPCNKDTRQMFQITAVELQNLIDDAVNEDPHGDVVVAVSNKSDLTGNQWQVSNPAIFPYVNHPPTELLFKGNLQNVKTDRQMTIGVHLLNPEGNIYSKDIELPEGCQLVSFTETHSSVFAATRLGAHLVEGSVHVVQTGNMLHIEVAKLPGVTALQFAKIIPVTLTFQFDIDNLPVNNFGDGALPFVYPEIPSIKGCIGRYSV